MCVIIPTDIEKAFDKFQHLSLEKTNKNSQNNTTQQTRNKHDGYINKNSTVNIVLMVKV